MPSIFLCYARGDDSEPFDPGRSFAAKLHRDLSRRGFDVWFDRVSMPSRSLTFYQEVRDAIASRDRLLLIVGPKAVSSEYVRQEWQFAYFQADKVVTPILRRGDFPFVPDELKLLHCEDFRDDAQYEFHLKQLARILSEATPQLGELIGVPSLPAHFLSRTDRLVVLRDALRADLDRPVVISGAAAQVGLHGMGGIGKSVLASALAHDRKVREAFPDGIIWVGLGTLPDIAALQRRVHRDLGGNGAIENEHDGRTQLKQLFADKAVLLVIDDVWRRSDVDAFNVLGARCRAMITTRDAGLLKSLGGTHHVVELLTDEEAMDLLAQSSGIARDQLPNEAKEIIKECGRLPLAVSLAGAMIQAGTTWRDVTSALCEHQLEFLEDEHAAVAQHRNLWKTMEVSVHALPRDQRKRLAELAVFPNDEAIPTAAVTTLWESTGNLSSRQARQLLVKFKQRSLVQLTSAVGFAGEGIGQVSLHDLIHDFCVRFARREIGDDRAVQRRLLDAYRAKCSSGWASGPNDGYFFTHLRHHLVEADLGIEIVGLFNDIRWLETKNKYGFVFDLGKDFAAAQKILKVDDQRASILRLLEEALRRDIHFIDRHREDYPQGMFQCLWNSCWWHDSTGPGNDRSSPGKRSPEGPVGRDEHLSALLERWRDTFHAIDPARSWVRSQRSPPVPLDSPLEAILRGHEHSVTAIAFSPDGQRIASASRDQSVRIWDTTTGREIFRLWGHQAVVNCVAYSADGRQIITGSHDETIRLWDAHAGYEVECLPEPIGWFTWSLDMETRDLLSQAVGFKGWVRTAVFSPDSRTIASAGADYRIRIWDLATRREMIVLAEHTDVVKSLAYSPNGKLLISGSRDQTVRVWEAATGKELAILCGHEGAVNTVVFSPDGAWIVSGSRDKTVRVWDPQTYRELATLRGHQADVNSVQCSPNGKRIASASDDTTVRIWDRDAQREVTCFNGHEDWVTSVAWSPDGAKVASCSNDRSIRIWSMKPHLRIGDVDVVVADLNCILFSPDGAHLAIGSVDGTLRVAESSGGTGERIVGEEGDTRCFAYSSDGRRILSVSPKNQMRVWEAATGRNLAHFALDANDAYCVAYSPDGNEAAIGSSHAWRIKNVLSGRERICNDGTGVLSIAFSPNGHRIAGGTVHGDVRVWSAESAREVARLHGHKRRVYRVAYSRDGERIATCSQESVRIWDTRTWDCVETIEGQGDVVAIAVGPPSFPYLVLANDVETWIVDRSTGRQIGWYSTALRHVVTHPTGIQFAGSSGRRVHLIAIEFGRDAK